VHHNLNVVAKWCKAHSGRAGREAQSLCTPNTTYTGAWLGGFDE
jgi:hypothetical protein